MQATINMPWVKQAYDAGFAAALEKFGAISSAFLTSHGAAAFGLKRAGFVSEQNARLTGTDDPEEQKRWMMNHALMSHLAAGAHPPPAVHSSRGAWVPPGGGGPPPGSGGGGTRGMRTPVFA